MRQPTVTSTRLGRGILALLVVPAMLVGACADTTPSSAPPTALPTATAGVMPTTGPSVMTSPEPTTAPSPGSTLHALVPGALAETVTDDLRVRSEPAVVASSVKFTPLLAKGTPLVITAGPVEASGYTWFRVAPIGVKLADGVDQGWVAVADHDGTPWVSLASDPTPGFDLATGSLDRPDASLAAAKAEAAALNTFGIALYKRMLADPEIVSPGRGMVFSPASIVTALAMARAGAKGDTAAEMDSVLRVDGWQPLSTGLNSLDQLLRSRDATWKNEWEEGDPHVLALRTANMAFGQDGYPLEPAYLADLGRTFGSGLGLVDYIGRTDAARQAINGWVSRQTMARIPELLTPPDVTGATRLVLVNAVYLKAEWARPFMVGETRDRTFTTAGGATTKVPTMELYGGQDVVLASGHGWKATELRYAGPGDSTPLAMTLVVPDSLAAFERSLSPKMVAAIQSGIRAEQKRISVSSSTDAENDCGSYPYNVHLFMPRFGIETRGSLNRSLQALGMKTPFDAATADFTGMTSEDRLHIGSVIHQANIDVDEKGTEAAAATAIGMDTGGCTGPQPATTKTLRLDKPFVFMLRDVQTGAILFMGRVTDPSKR